MTDEMKPVSTQDLRAVALYLTTGGARAGSFEFDTEDGRRIRLSATEVGGPFDEALSAPSSPGDGWVMVPIVPRDEMVRAGDAVLAQSTWPDADDIWTAMIDARPLPTEGDAGRAALEAEKTTHQEPEHER